MSAEAQLVCYRPVYGRVLILLGVVFSAIFILGFIIADMVEALFYNILSAAMIIVGFGILKGPYIIYDDSQLILYAYGLKERERINYKNKTAIEVKNNRLYYQGKKVKINEWFIKKADWERLIRFYSGKETDLLDELKD